MINYKGDAEANESFGLRHVVPSGLVPQVSEKDFRAGRGPGTSGTDHSGNRRGVRYRDTGDGADGGTHSCFGIVSAEPVDRGGSENHKKFERARAVPRVPEFEKKFVGRGDLGRRVFCPDCRRPNDSGCNHEVYSTSSRTRARACAACFEAALLMPRGLPRGYLLVPSLFMIYILPKLSFSLIKKLSWLIRLIETGFFESINPQISPEAIIIYFP
jgi:hypothetical protein